MAAEQECLRSIEALSRTKQVAFALLVLERMLPSLVNFAKDTGFNDSSYVRGREAAWAALQGAGGESFLADLCLKSAPDTEAYSHELTSYALNAALAMGEVLEFVSDGQIRHMGTLLGLATDSLDLFASNSSSPSAYTSERDQEIAVRPLLEREHRRQQDDIRFLAGLPDHFSQETIQALRARADTQAPLVPRLRQQAG